MLCRISKSSKLLFHETVCPAQVVGEGEGLVQQGEEGVGLVQQGEEGFGLQRWMAHL